MRSSARGASAAGSRWAKCCPSRGAPVMATWPDDRVAQGPLTALPTAPPSRGARAGRSGTAGRGLRRAEGVDGHVVALPAHSVSRRCTPDLAFQLGEPEKRIAPPLGDDLGIAPADPSARAMCSRSSGGWRMNRPRSSSKTSWSPLIRQGPRMTWASLPVSQEPGAGGAPTVMNPSSSGKTTPGKASVPGGGRNQQRVPADEVGNGRHVGALQACARSSRPAFQKGRWYPSSLGWPVHMAGHHTGQRLRCA
jgi:hypothetical protein